MYIKSYAKINLFLDVVSKKEDGYHDLKMVMIPITLHDSIDITSLKYFKDDYITCDHVELRDSKYNTINVAITKLRDLTHFKNHFNIHVHKEIPIQSGLGGGSSNAAFVLNAINKTLKLNVSKDELISIAKTVGADVPFFVNNKPAYVAGIGEKLTEISLKHQYFVIIIKPQKGLSTKTVFATGDNMELEHGNIDNVIQALENGDDEALAKSMFNALEKPATSLAPEIKNFKDMLRDDGFKMVLMSGSGSAVYALTSDRHFAKRMFKKYINDGYDAYLSKTIG